MKTKQALGLFMAGLLGVNAFTGCEKKATENNNTENNSSTTTPISSDNPINEGDKTEMNNVQFNAALLDTEIEKSDLVADDKLYEEAVKINVAAWRYYNDKFKEAAFISNCGYLYSLNSGKEVSMDDLVNGGYYTVPEGMEKLMGTDILLLMPIDIINRDVDVMDATFACLFTAIRTSDGVFISSPEDKGGMMSYEKYREMLIDYVPEHGDIVYPKKNDDNYTALLSAISEKEGKELDVDVKYMVCDDAYAIVVLGDNKNITDIKEYILEKADGKWVLNDKGCGLEKSNDNITGINVNFPKIPAAMLPMFTIGTKQPIITDLSKYITTLEELGLINSNDLPATYQIGCGKFIYIEFNSGKKIVGGAGADNNLKCVEVKNAAEAVKYMRSIDKTAPIYIIKMNF